MQLIAFPSPEHYDPLVHHRHSRHLPVNLFPLPKVQLGELLYFLLYRFDIVYIGRSYNVRRRVAYEHGDKEFGAVMVMDAPDMERHYINLYKPRYNIQSK